MRILPNPFYEHTQDVVAADGTLMIMHGPNYDQTWTITQISIEMPTAPVGATCVVRRMGVFITNADNPRLATAAGEPPLFLNGGEHFTVEWEGCTPGDIGKVTCSYIKAMY